MFLLFDVFVVVAPGLQSWETFFCRGVWLHGKEHGIQWNYPDQFQKMSKEGHTRLRGSKIWVDFQQANCVFPHIEICIFFSRQHRQISKNTSESSAERQLGGRALDHRHDAWDICGAQVTHPPQHKHHPSLKIWWTFQSLKDNTRKRSPQKRPMLLNVLGSRL